jgi:hypothetical protein
MAKENSYLITGTVHKVDEVKSYGEKGFKKREWVLEVNSEYGDGMIYKDFIQFEAVKTFAESLTYIKPGDEVEVKFSVGGRKYSPKDGGDDKFFVSLKSWDVKVRGASQHAPVASGYNDYLHQEGTDDPDLPF